MEFTRHHLSLKGFDCKFNFRRAAKTIDLKRQTFLSWRETGNQRKRSPV